MPLRLNWDALKPFNPGILGFNPSFRVSKEAQGDFLHPNWVRLLDLFPAYALRFPPGTYASFYDWDSGTLDPELAKQYGNKAMLRTIKSQHTRVGALIRSDYRSFLDLVSTRGISPYIVLNLYTHDSRDAEQTVDRVRSRVRVPIHWELGNELSQYGYRGNWLRPWNGDIYVQRALAVARFIRQQGTADEIGVDGAELLRERGHLSVPQRVRNVNTAWNDRLIQDIGAFDAVIFHPYINFVPQVIKAGTREVEASGTCTDAAAEVRRTTVDYRWVFSAAQAVPAAYKDYVSVHFPGKRVWITEVGLAGTARAGGLDFGASGILRSLFNISYFAHWVEAFPDLGAYMFHVLGEGKGPFSAIYPDGSFNSNATSYVFLRKLLKGATELGVETYEAGASLHGIGPNRDRIIRPVIAILVRTPTARRMLIANIGFSSVAVETPFTRARLTHLGGLPPVSLRPGRVRSFADFSGAVSDAPTLTLGPASITLIEDANAANP